MSYFVTVTFDLKDAKNSSPYGNNVYKKITDALDALDYSTIVSGHKNKVTELPANTYVAKFEDDVDHQSEIADFVKKELALIFARYSVTGKYFISTGRGWSWKVGVI